MKIKINNSYFKQIVQEEYHKFSNEELQPAAMHLASGEPLSAAQEKYQYVQQYEQQFGDPPLEDFAYPFGIEHATDDLEDFVASRTAQSQPGWKDWHEAYQDPYHLLHDEAVSALPLMDPEKYIYPEKLKAMMASAQVIEETLQENASSNVATWWTNPVGDFGTEESYVDPEGNVIGQSREASASEIYTRHGGDLSDRYGRHYRDAQMRGQEEEWNPFESEMISYDPGDTYYRMHTPVYPRTRKEAEHGTYHLNELNNIINEELQILLQEGWPFGQREKKIGLGDEVRHRFAHDWGQIGIGKVSTRPIKDDGTVGVYWDRSRRQTNEYREDLIFVTNKN